MMQTEATTSVPGIKRGPSAVSASRPPPPPPPPAIISSDNEAETTDGFVAQVLGMLGLLEVWVFLVYIAGARFLFSDFEMLIFNVLGSFELLGRLPGMLALCLLCNDSSSVDHPDNIKTITRDQLHNMVYPRSPPRSRKRRDFASMAWYSLLVTVIPVVLLLSFYPVWSSWFDGPLWIRAMPSVLAVLAVLESLAGSFYMSLNESSYVLTIMYANAKIISLLVLVAGANRLLFGEEDGENEDGDDGGFAVGEGDGDGGGAGLVFLGIPLACLQAVKMASACAAAVSYLRGRPDEQLPSFLDAMKLCHFAHA